MKLFLRILAFILLASNVGSEIKAAYNDRYENGCCPTNNCNTCCYECGCEALYHNAFDVQFHAGAAPIVWTDKGDISFVQCMANPVTSGIAFLFEVPRFFKLFRVPWTVGAQVGYALDQHVRLFAEFNYLQANGKGNALVTSEGVAVPQTIAFSLRKYKLFDVYLGAQYYWNRACDWVAPFVGVKFGLTHRQHTRFSSTLTSAQIVPPVTLTDNVDLFHGHTVPSGGLQLGLDFCFCGCWSVQLVGELVAACGPDSAQIPFGQIDNCQVIQPVPVPGINNLLIGHIGTELRFPITLGIRYSFQFEINKHQYLIFKLNFEQAGVWLQWLIILKEKI